MAPTLADMKRSGVLKRHNATDTFQTSTSVIVLQGKPQN